MTCNSSVRDEGPCPSPDGFPAAGVVHDLGNLIMIATSAVNIISRNPRAGRDEALEPVISRAQTALERAGQLIREANRRTLAPRFTVHASAPGLQRISTCLEEIRGLLAWICEPGIALSIEIEPDLPLVHCSSIELQNAVLNLVINARDATPEGGSIGILAHRAPNGPLGEALVLSVVDDGVGMSPETLAQAFNPYFTTKADGRGSGLGLAMVRRFAWEAGGRVDITSAPGEGAAVTLRLPPASATCSKPQPSYPAG